MEFATSIFMLTLARLSPETDADHEIPARSAMTTQPECYGITIFTLQFLEVRDFYVHLLNAQVLHEKRGRICQLDLAGIPVCLRRVDHGETVSYFHLHLVLRYQDSILRELRHRGVIVTTNGPFTNFRDPEGRVIKLSEERIPIS